MKEFQIIGTITIPFNFEIEAESEEMARQEAIDSLRDDYHLDVNGYNHEPDEVVVELDAIEYAD